MTSKQEKIVDSFDAEIKVGDFLIIGDKFRNAFGVCDAVKPNGDIGVAEISFHDEGRWVDDQGNPVGDNNVDYEFHEWQITGKKVVIRKTTYHYSSRLTVIPPEIILQNGENRPLYEKALEYQVGVLNNVDKKLKLKKK